VASRTKRFQARVRSTGPYTYVTVPEHVSRAFATYAEKGRVRVFGRLEDAEIRGTLVPRATGHWLFLHAAMRAAASVRVGGIARLELRATQWDDVPVGRDVKRALGAAALEDRFEALSASRRHELIRWVDAAELPERRAKRIDALIEDLKDASVPRKKGQPGKRLKPLWKCPECGHVFVNRNQWHSCKRYTLAEPLSKGGSLARELFAQVRKAVASVGPTNVQAYRDKVSFLVRVRFLSVTPRKRWIDLGFWLPRRIESARWRKVETLTPTDHVHVLRVRAASDIDDEVIGWIREAYAVGEQKHLG